MNDAYLRKLSITNIPKVYYQTRYSTFKNVISGVDYHNTNLLITGDSPRKRTIFATTLLKEVMKKSPGCLYYRFDIMIEHFRENKFLDLLEKFVGKTYLVIDNMDFYYLGPDYWTSNVYRRFCSFFRELYESQSKRFMYVTTPHNMMDLESNLPKFMYEIIDNSFNMIDL